MNERRDFSLDDESDELKPQERPVEEGGVYPPDTEGLAAELEAARADARDWQDKYLRKLAEFDNFRRRTRQETAMLRQAVAESLVAALLPVMDDMDRLLAAAGNADDPLRRGAEMVRDKLRAFFDAQGVTSIAAQGQPFDPEAHDAIMLRPMPGFPAGTVLEVITPGYRLGDRVIRHAQVIVSAEAEEETPDDQAHDRTPGGPPQI